MHIHGIYEQSPDEKWAKKYLLESQLLHISYILRMQNIDWTNECVISNMHLFIFIFAYKSMANFSIGICHRRHVINFLNWDGFTVNCANMHMCKLVQICAYIQSVSAVETQNIWNNKTEKKWRPYFPLVNGCTAHKFHAAQLTHIIPYGKLHIVMFFSLYKLWSVRIAQQRVCQFGIIWLAWIN